MVTAPVAELRMANPAMEKFLSMVVIMGLALAFVALKFTVLRAPGVNVASPELPSVEVVQLVEAPLETLAYQLLLARPVQ